jgi:hypothetical protein
MEDTASDISSEAAVEEIIRQIMTEARLWEAIQEANREIMMQKLAYNRQHTYSNKHVGSSPDRLYKQLAESE